MPESASLWRRELCRIIKSGAYDKTGKGVIQNYGELK